MNNSTGKVIQGDCLDIMKNIPDNSIDLICTDPPYFYGFMNKDWDKEGAVDFVAVWKECLRVMKPGAFAFVMAAPRQDVLSKQIQYMTEAGFDMSYTSIYWTYSCLSNDTEVLTEDGWVSGYNMLSDKQTNAKILIYDADKSEYKWEVPTRWNYNINKNTAWSIKSDFTDQIVTSNHRVYIEQDGKLVSSTPQEIEKTRMGENGEWKCLVPMPVLPTSISTVTSEITPEEGSWDLLQHKLSSESTDKNISSRQEAPYTSYVGRSEAEAEACLVRSKEHGVEGWNNVSQAERKLCKSAVYAMSSGISSNGKEGWLCNDASNGYGKTNRKMSNKNGMRASYRPQSIKQQHKQSYAIQKQSRPQAVRNGHTYTTTLATFTKCEYKQLVYCPTVSTGCFVARRNGKMFITGNSGFPKALNISKALKKKNNPRADEFVGSMAGFQPKPAVEIIIVAMKPLSKKTYVDQALYNGKGITWLDDCRIPYQSDKDIPNECVATDMIHAMHGVPKDEVWRNEAKYTPSQQGRFPANLLVSDNVLDDGKISKQGKVRTGKQTVNTFDFYSDKESDNGDTPTGVWYNDGGSYSRYFDLDKWHKENNIPLEHSTYPFLIIPKSSKSQKNEGCEDLYILRSDTPENIRKEIMAYV